MRIAAIDCGTNSIHMIVVRIRPDLSFEVIDREKEMVRLGSGGLDGKALTAESDGCRPAGVFALSPARRVASGRRNSRGGHQRRARGGKRRRISRRRRARNRHQASSHLGHRRSPAHSSRRRLRRRCCRGLGGGRGYRRRQRRNHPRRGHFSPCREKLQARRHQADGAVRPHRPAIGTGRTKARQAHPGSALEISARHQDRRLRPRHRHVGHDSQPRHGCVRRAPAGRATRFATCACRPSRFTGFAKTSPIAASASG